MKGRKELREREKEREIGREKERREERGEKEREGERGGGEQEREREREREAGREKPIYSVALPFKLRIVGPSFRGFQYNFADCITKIFSTKKEKGKMMRRT